MGLSTQPGRRVLYVGVTGHRFLAEVDRLRVAVDAALDRLAAQYPDHRLTALSPLAEGADRLVAHAALARGGGLIVPLPFPVEEYSRDFETAESMGEFGRLLAQAEEVLVLPPVATRNEAYAGVGSYIADRCDALIALWDGQGAQGQGGTAEVVYRALNRRIPVIHILCGNRKPGTSEPTSLGEQQGELVVHNL